VAVAKYIAEMPFDAMQIPGLAPGLVVSAFRRECQPVKIEILIKRRFDDLEVG
jgi:hypothetical protein